MTRRLRVPVYRGGQGRPVAMTPSQTYTPMTWDETEPRVKDLLAYRPKKHKEQWLEHAEVVRDLVLRTDYFDRLRDRHLTGTLHMFFAWAKNHNFSTDPASLLAGDRIDLFVRERYQPGSHTTHQWRLRHVATTVFPPPQEAVTPRRPPMDPHTFDERDGFTAAAESLIAGHFASLPSRQDLYRDVRVVLALTFGAGCNGQAVHRVREGWLRQSTDGVWLDRPDRAVATPVEEPWASILMSARTGNPEAWLLRPNTVNARNEQVGKVFLRARKWAPGFHGFDSDRAARRWQVDVLARANFGDLIALLGYKPGSQTPVDLAQHLAPSETSELLTRVRGWVA